MTTSQPATNGSTKAEPMDTEEGEITEDTPFKLNREESKWKKSMGGTVDVNKLKNLASRLAKDDESDREETTDSGKCYTLHS